MKWFVWTVIAIVAASIIAGFFIVGSPATERMRRFDDERITDLQNIQWQIVNFWQRKERLPEPLDELKDDISGWSAPQDPENGKVYEYIVDNKLSFALCADFSLKSGAEFGGDDYTIALTESNWDHPQGRHCFKRVIDPELYPSFEKTAKPAR